MLHYRTPHDEINVMKTTAKMPRATHDCTYTISARNARKITMNRKNAVILYTITARNAEKSAMNANAKAVMNVVVMNKHESCDKNCHAESREERSDECRDERRTDPSLIKKIGRRSGRKNKIRRIQVLSRR